MPSDAHERTNRFKLGVVDQGDRLGRADTGRPGSGWSPRRRRALVIAAAVVVLGAFVALLATNDAENEECPPAFPACTDDP